MEVSIYTWKRVGYIGKKVEELQRDFPKLKINVFERGEVKDYKESEYIVAVDMTREELLERVREASGVNLLLDFHKVEHVSIEFFKEVLRVDAAVSATGGTMRLCGLRKPIRDILETSDLDHWLRIEGTVQHTLPRYVRFLEHKNHEPAQRTSHGVSR